MAADKSKFINVVSSGAIANGASVVVPHGLNRGGVKLVPDIYAANRGGFTISVDDTNVTFTNNTGAAATCGCYVRWDHSIQRVFGPDGQQTLVGYPFDIAGSGTAGVGVTLAQAYLNGPAGGQVIALNTTQDGIFIRHITGILAQTALAVQNAAGTTTFFGVLGGTTDDVGGVGINGHVAIAAIAGAGSTGVNTEVLLVTGATNTGIQASNEVAQVRFDLAQVRTWETGALTLQRTFRIGAETLAFVGASTVTDAVTFYVTGAPVAGANATLTQRWAAWFGGAVFIGNTTPLTNNALTIYNTGVVIAQVRTASAANYAQVAVTNETVGEGRFTCYGGTFPGTVLGLTAANATFLTTGVIGMGVGTTGAIPLHLGTADTTRLLISGTDVEGAKVTAVYISENAVLKRITIGATAGAGPLAGAADVGLFCLQVA